MKTNFIATFILLLTIFYFGLSDIRASVVTEENGFTLEFNGKEFYKEFSNIKMSRFDDFYFRTGFSRNDEQFWNSGVYCGFNVYMDEYSKDFGFVNDNMFAKFSVNSYNTDIMYIEKIEIDWTDGENSGGLLNILGSCNEKSPYEPSFLSDAAFKGVENDVDMIVAPSLTGQPVTDTYIFEKPIRYLAFIFVDRGRYNIAQFQGFRIKFTYDDPTANTTSIECLNAVNPEDSETIYYTIDGHRVNPGSMHNGIFIKRTGGNVEKILVR